MLTSGLPLDKQEHKGLGCAILVVPPSMTNTEPGPAGLQYCTRNNNMAQKSHSPKSHSRIHIRMDADPHGTKPRALACGKRQRLPLQAWS